MADKTFGDSSVAQAMRDVIKKFIREEIMLLRPPPRVATVVSIDGANHKCTVLYAGDTTPITIRMFSIRPGAAGNVVRVEGVSSQRYVADVVTGTATFYTGSR